jgi:tetratricopeptide (TPR) repeat protein
MIRDPECLHNQYNKKLDIWSFGCLIYELSTGQKAFSSDWACYDFAMSKHFPEIPFCSWLDETSKNVLNRWIAATLEVEYTHRPSVEDLASRFGELAPLLESNSGNRYLVSAYDWMSEENILSSDVALSQGVLRWEEVLTTGGFEQHLRMLQRYARIVRTRKKILGSGHPYTVWSTTCCAWTAFYLGAPDIAKAAFEEILERKTVLGDENPQMLSIEVGLGWTLINYEQYPTAYQILDDTLKVQKTVLGLDHPDTLACMQGLATLRSNLGEFETAAAIFEEAYQIQMRALGECSDTLLSLAGLAWAHLKMGHTEIAAQLYEKAAEAQIRVLQLDHPDTLDSLSGRAMAYEDLGRLKESIDAFEEIISTQSRVLGPHHYSYWESMTTLIREYGKVGRKADAVRLKSKERKARKARIPWVDISIE